MRNVIEDLKKSLLLLFYAGCLLLMNACSSSDYDDSVLVDRVDNLEDRIETLEEFCKQMNTNISSLQVLVTALQNNDYITGIIPIKQGNNILGYTISFGKAESITIFNGKDGINGVDGENGSDGKDGMTPLIGAKQDTDGIFYWTLNGKWLKDEDGNKIQVQGTNGKDGEDGMNGTDGKDAMVPLLKIINNYWYVSYDNGVAWVLLGKATGENGDNIFKNIDVDENRVLFVLNDETMFEVPINIVSRLTVEVKESGTLKDLLTNKQKRELSSLKIIGELNNEDIRTLNFQMQSLGDLDLSEVLWNVEKEGELDLNPYGERIFNKTIKNVILPTKNMGLLSVKICGWVSLEKVVITADSIMLNAEGYSLDSLVYSEKNTMVYYSNCSKFNNIDLPSTMKDIYYNTFLWAHYVSGTVNFWEYSKIKTVICRSVIPPRLGEWHYISDNINLQSVYMFKERTNVWASAEEKKKLSECTLLVPLNSIELYKRANGWKEFGNIKSID